MGSPAGLPAFRYPRLRKAGYRAFYMLPSGLRRRLVRLAMARYAVGAVALVRDSEAAPPGRLLLLRQPPGLGWTLPAGLLKRRERPIDGCVRELAEETGLMLDVTDFTPARPNAIVHSRGMWVDTVFETEVAASTANLVVDGAEVLEAAFHPLNNLPPLTISTARMLSYYGIGPYADYPEVQV